MKRCPYCGIELVITIEREIFCKNCGYVENLNESDEENPKYVD